MLVHYHVGQPLKDPILVESTWMNWGLENHD